MSTFLSFQHEIAFIYTPWSLRESRRLAWGGVGYIFDASSWRAREDGASARSEQGERTSCLLEGERN